MALSLMGKRIPRAFVVGVFAAALLTSGNVQADTTLFAWDTYTFGDDVLVSLDTSGPSGVAVGPDDPVYGVIAEIEFGGGIIYGADTGDNTLLHSIDPATGAPLDVLSLTFPGEGDVLTSLEFVGDTLYAGLTTEGGGPTYLSTVDLGTGAVSVVGPTGFDSPFGGLAFEGSARSGLMYGISAGGSAGELFTIDLGTGDATSVGLVTVDGEGVGTTALEFGDDGVLYALPHVGESIAGHLLSIDPATGDATDLGSTGVDGLVALTTPEPSTLTLLGLVGLLVCARRRMA